MRSSHSIGLIAAIIAIVATLSFPVGSAAASTAGKASHAVMLVRQGQYDEARLALRSAVGGRPDAALHLAHLEGLILLREGRRGEAIDLFRFVLSREPNFTPARIELSRALAANGDADAALHQLQIIELGSNDPEIRRQARSFGDTVRSRRPYGFSGYLGFLPSTNINKGSRRSVITIGGMEFEIDEGGREQSGIGFAAGGNAYRRFYLDPSSWITVSGAADVKKYSASDDYDELALSANVAFARRFGRTVVEIGPTIDYRLVAWEPYAFRYGASVALRTPIGAHTSLRAGATYLRQDFLSASYRDGWTMLAYAGIRHAFSPSTAFSIVGTLVTERTRRDYLDHDDIGVSAQLDREWTGGLITSIAVGLAAHDYKGAFPGMAEARSDTVWNAGVTLLNRNWSFQGFSPQLSYSYKNQISNVAFYDYDSHDVDLAFTKRF